MNWIVLALLVAAPTALQTSSPETTGHYLMGKPDSPVRIEVFSDFECPACRGFFLDTVFPLMDQYAAGDKVALVFHDYPLPMHPSSRTAALYSLASSFLGREQFVKVINTLYTCQAEWAYNGKIEPVLARVLNPDEMTKVTDKLKDPALEQTITREIELGKKKSVVSTPTFFVTMRGKEERVVGGLSFSSLNAFIAPNAK